MILTLVIDGLPQPSPKRQILDSSKVKEFADDNYKFGENARKFSKQEQFLLFPQCFQKTCLQTRKHPGLFGKVLTAI